MSFVTAAVGLGAAAYSIGHGLNQKRKAKKAQAGLDAKGRPIEGISAGAKEELDNARQQAGSTQIPGASIAQNRINQQVGAQSNRILQTGGSTGEIINGLSNVNQNGLNAQNDLAFKGAQLNQENQAMFRGVLSDIGQRQDHNWQTNNMDPYQTKTLQNQQMKQSGDANITNGFDRGIDSSNMYQVGKGYKKSRQVGFSSDNSSINGMPDYNDTYSRS